MNRKEYRSGRGELLAVLYSTTARSTEDSPRWQITEHVQLLQVAEIVNNGTGTMAFEPHWHLPQLRTTVGTAEMWIVRKGRVKVTVYDTENRRVDVLFLDDGDLFVSLAGGHGYEMEPGAEVIEVKNGPYNGRQADKQVIKQ